MHRPYRAENIDEYRELDMLAHAWERGPLEPGTPEDAPRHIEDAQDATAGAEAPPALGT